MKYLANAFSLQMLAVLPASATISEISEMEFENDTAGAVSCIGHPDTAAVLGVPCSRINVTLEQGDVLYVAQLQGGRLPEGVTTLPEGFYFKYLKVEVL